METTDQIHKDVISKFDEERALYLHGIDSTDYTLQINKDKYLSLIDSIDQGFFVIDILFDENERPVDMYYVEANLAATKMLGVDFSGKWLREINPNYEEYWFEIFGSVATTGKSVRMEQYSKTDKMWFDINIFKIGGADSRRIGNLFQNITERKKTEEALKENEAKCRTMFNSLHEGYCIIEVVFDSKEKPVDYRFLEVNTAFENQTGLSEATGKLIRDLAPEHEDCWFEIYGKVALTGEPVHFENEAKALNRFYEVCAFKIGEPETRKVAVVFNDISNRKRAEEDAKRYAEFESTVLTLAKNFINMPIIEIDNGINNVMQIVGSYLEVDRSSIYKYDWENERITRLYGWDKQLDRPTGEKWDVLPLCAIADIVECHKKGIPHFLDDITNYPQESSYYRTMKERNSHSTGTFPLLVKGKLWGTLGFSTNTKPKIWSDINISTITILTEMIENVLLRKERVKALQQANESNRLMLDSTNDAIAMYDTEGYILNANKSLAQSYNTTVEGMIGLNHKVFVPDKYGDLFEQRNSRFLRAISTGNPEVFEDCRDNMWCNNRYYPVFTDGKVTAVTFFSTDISIRKIAEEEALRNAQLLKKAEMFRQKEQEYLEILDGSTEGSWIYDIKNMIMEYSPEWIKRIGGESIPTEDLYQYAQSIIHPDDRERLSAVLRAGTTSKRHKNNLEYRTNTVDGGYRWISSRWKTMYDENGAPDKHYGTLMDITDCKYTELLLIKQNAIQLATNNIYEKAITCETIEEFGKACLDIIESNTKSQFSFVSEIGCDGLYRIAMSDRGMEHCNMQDKTGHKKPTENFKISGIYGSVIKSGKSLITNDPSAHPNSIGIPKGHFKLTAFLGVPLIRNGIVTGMIGVANREGGYRSEDQEILEALAPTILEVFQRKRAEDALRQSESLLHTIIEETTDPIFLKDRYSKFIMANAATGLVVGLPVDDIIGKTARDVFLDKQKAEITSQNDKRIVETDKAEVVEEEILSPGGMRTYLSAKVPWHDKDGNVIGIIGVARDITERKAMEVQLKSTAEELAKKNKLITEFFTNISHEFKTPLAVILLQFELMKMYLDDEAKLQKMIAVASQNSYRLSRLIGNILDTTKIEAGYLDVHYTNADVVSSLQDLCDSVDAYARKKSIQLSFDTALSVKEMPLDLDKIERIMLNLLSNAIKHTGKGGEIKVSVQENKEGGVIISIEDTGVGIPQDKLATIFDRFAQVDTSFSRLNGGCGIGLALVKSLVHMLNGEITVKSELGKGSQFIIELPLINSSSQTKETNHTSFELSKKVEMELSDL